MKRIAFRSAISIAALAGIVSCAAFADGPPAAHHHHASPAVVAKPAASVPAPAAAPAAAAQPATPAGAGAAGVAGVNVTAVDIRDFAFSPAIVTIPAGASVHWVNRDDEPHSVAAEDKSYRSALLNTDDSYTRVYSQPGEYPYYCTLHPHMRGKIVVVAGKIAGPAPKGG